MTKGTEAALEPLVINGWTIYAHPLFLQELEALAQKFEVLRILPRPNTAREARRGRSTPTGFARSSSSSTACFSGSMRPASY